MIALIHIARAALDAAQASLPYSPLALAAAVQAVAARIDDVDDDEAAPGPSAGTVDR